MKDQIKKYLNIYVVVGFIGFFSFAYMFSFMLVLNDVTNGSSLQMKREMMKKQQTESYTDISNIEFCKDI